jgi:hypothetical protein
MKKQTEIPPNIQLVYLELIGLGMTDNQAAQVCGVSRPSIYRLAKANEVFNSAWNTAKELRLGRITKAIATSMLAQIEAGHPWWTKLAIRSYPKCGFKNPDLSEKIAVEKAKARLGTNKDSPKEEPVSDVNIVIKPVETKTDNGTPVKPAS